MKNLTLILITHLHFFACTKEVEKNPRSCDFDTTLVDGKCLRHDYIAKKADKDLAKIYDHHFIKAVFDVDNSDGWTQYSFNPKSFSQLLK